MNPEEAERYILSRELFGMRFGLDRMRRLMTAMGNPQLRFQSIHVVGTNGKSSTVRMTAAILRRHGLRTGAYLSPHLVSFAERIRIEDEDLEPGEFAGAIQRAAHAAELVDRSLGPDDRVTQFELLTAAAYSELARQGVEVAVIEAGLGGRYDATNVIPSRVQVLTSVGLEHTRWLGPTITAIATEKLDVVQPGATLVLGYGLNPEAVAVAERVAGNRHPPARIVHAGADPGVPLTALGPYQRRNFALARTAAEAYLGELDPNAVATAAAETLVPGRLQVVDEEPLTLLDGAHNPEGIAALAESLADPFAAGRKPVVAVISILDDKDAAGMLATLMPMCDALVLTASQNPRALPPPTLQSLAGQLGGPPSEVIRDPRAAVARGRELAGPDGLVVATGSIYLVADLLRPAGAGRASML
ncbi:MAG: bifunctional folylpolyglutamate synthase/dihydrofolate synthase [Solirubrobacteraceae bacterium]